MPSVSERESCSPATTTRSFTMTGLSRQQQVRFLTSMWEDCTPSERQILLNEPGNELAAAIWDSFVWMSKWTKSRDDQDSITPFKPLNRPYLKVVHDIWMREPFLYVEKTRSMLMSWWSVAESMHDVMTHQPAKGIFWAQDEDRAVLLRDYAWTLYEQQDEQLRRLFPVIRPRVKQSYDKLEFADGGLLLALPGKDPNKIRSEHPTVLVIDEANFIDNVGEALDVALASRVPKVLLVSSAAPSALERVAKASVPEEIKA
jgi:hypothetical protein